MPPLRRALLLLVALLVLELAAWPLTWLSSRELDDELRLRREGVEATARVTALRRHKLRRHDVRYALDVPGAGTITLRDRTGREDLWTSIAPSAADDAEAGRVRVLYLPDDPWVSRPIDVAPGVSPLGDPLAALLAIALPLHVLAAALWGRALRDIARARAAAERDRARARS